MDQWQTHRRRLQQLSRFCGVLQQTTTSPTTLAPDATHIHHINREVADLGAALDFYQAIGFRRLRRPDGLPTTNSSEAIARPTSEGACLLELPPSPVISSY